MFSFKAEQKYLDISMIKSDELDSSEGFWPEKLNTDENRLRQIVINLIGNALNYTDEGYVRILSHLDEQRRTFSIIVKDTGVGMTSSQQKRLFTAFSKIVTHKDLNNAGQGKGLGLSISKKLANALNGDLKVSSKINVGTKFILILPISQ